ncbi:MAG: FG-GAP repeat domain-containing protein [Bacteroidota bacterium]
MKSKQMFTGRSEYLSKEVMMRSKQVWITVCLIGLVATSSGICSEFRVGNIHKEWFPPSLTILEFHVGEAVSLEVGDFDGDGWVDLIVGVYHTKSGRQLLVFYIPNTGDGHFVSPCLVAESPELESAIQGAGGEGVVVDLDNDGKLDVVTFYALTIMENGTPSVKNYLLVLWGNGDGTFRQQWLEMPLVVYTFMQPVNPIAVGDFDGDGLKDIAYSKFYPPSVEILYNRGNYTWEKTEGSGILTEGEGCVAIPLSLAASDFDGNGKSDLVVGGFCVFNADEPQQQEYKRFVKVFFAEDEGRFQETFGYISDVPDLTPLAPSLYITDLTGDEIEDLVITKPFRKQTPQELYLDREWIDQIVLFIRGTQTVRFFGPVTMQGVWGGILIYLEGKLPSYTFIGLSLGGRLGIAQFTGSLGGGFGLIENAVAATLADLDNDGWVEVVAAIRPWTENATRIVIAARRKQ